MHSEHSRCLLENIIIGRKECPPVEEKISSSCAAYLERRFSCEDNNLIVRKPCVGLFLTIFFLVASQRFKTLASVTFVLATCLRVSVPRQCWRRYTRNIADSCCLRPQLTLMLRFKPVVCEIGRQLTRRVLLRQVSCDSLSRLRTCVPSCPLEFGSKAASVL